MIKELKKELKVPFKLTRLVFFCSKRSKPFARSSPAAARSLQPSDLHRPLLLRDFTDSADDDQIRFVPGQLLYLRRQQLLLVELDQGWLQLLVPSILYSLALAHLSFSATLGK